MNFILNNRTMNEEVAPGTLAIDYLRRDVLLKGTKEGCREGDCGACTVLVGELKGTTLCYRAMSSCLLLMCELEGKHLVTVEGLAREELTPVERLILDQGATQCGFCTPGIVLSLTGFAMCSADLGQDDAEVALDGNLCRCTGYASIKRAARALAQELTQLPGIHTDRVSALVTGGVLPPYFKEIIGKLAGLKKPGAAGYPAEGQTLVAGGTDLVLANQRALDGDLFLLSRRGRDEIQEDDDGLIIGAGATFESVGNSESVRSFVPHMNSYMKWIASSQIRNAATIGGNIVNASPIGDLTIILLAADAQLGLRKGDVARVLPLRDFFRGYKQIALKDGEYVEWVRIARAQRGAIFNFEKVSKRPQLDIASVNSAFSAAVDDGVVVHAHLSAGGVAPIPLYLADTCEFLRGKTVCSDTARMAAEFADKEISPMTDVRGSAAYKRLLLRQLIFAHFVSALGVSEDFQ